MKKILLLCVITVFAFAGQGQRKQEDVGVQTPYQTINAPDDVNPPVNPLVQQMFEARKNGDWTTYNRLLEEWKSQLPVPEDIGPAEIEIKPEQDPIMRWAGDKVIYAGNVAYNDWAMLDDIDDEAISVDHLRDDTLRAAVAGLDSTLRIFQSDDNGMTWFPVITWSTSVPIYEPEIINDPTGRFYQVFSRRGSNNGDLRVLIDSTPGGWFGVWIENTTDTVANYTVCSDRAQYGGGYLLFCAYHKRLGGAGLDEIWFTRSLDFGATWETPSLLQGAGSAYPDLAFGDNDYLYLTRLFYRTNDTINVYTRRSSNEGVTWFGSVEIQGDTMPKQGPQIVAAHDGSGDAWVVWPRRYIYTTPSNYDLLWSWSQDFGATWSSWDYMSSLNSEHTLLPSIAIYDANTYYSPYVSYIASDTNWTNPIVYSTYWQSDSTWATFETYNDSVPAFTRPIQTWETEGVPAIAYVGEGGVNVYYDSWSNTGVEERNAQILPEKLLSQNRPNPFTNSTRLEYYVPVNGKVSLRVYNAIGQEVAKLVDEYKNAGTYSITWNGADLHKITLPKGVYFLKLQVDKLSATRKLIIQ